MRGSNNMQVVASDNFFIGEIISGLNTMKNADFLSFLKLFDKFVRFPLILSKYI